MDWNEANEYVRHRVRVTRAMVADAKSFLLKTVRCAETDSKTLLQAFLSQVDGGLPMQVHLGPEVDAMPALEQIAVALSWRRASAEAVWGLIHGSLLIPIGPECREHAHVSWTTGRNSSGWDFDDLIIPVPSTLVRPPSHVGADVVLCDGDIYLRELSIPNIHPDVESALREAVACFQAELFTASMAMLGKASEGAWLDLGRSLVSAVPFHGREAIRNQVARLEDPMEGIGRKIGAVIEIFKRRDLLGGLSDAAPVRHQDLQQVRIWSDVVRDSRNTIHFGVSPAMANTFEKVATLLIGAIPHLRVLYVLKEKADKHALVMSRDSLDD